MKNKIQTVGQVVEYPCLMSKRGTCLSLTSYVRNQIYMDDEKMWFYIRPRRLEKVPVIECKNVQGITLGKKLALERLLYAIVYSCVGIFLISQGVPHGFIWLLAAAFTVAISFNSVIIIRTKDGREQRIISRDKGDAEVLAEQLKADIAKRVTKNM